MDWWSHSEASLFGHTLTTVMIACLQSSSHSSSSCSKQTRTLSGALKYVLFIPDFSCLFTNDGRAGVQELEPGSRRAGLLHAASDQLRGESVPCRIAQGKGG